MVGDKINRSQIIKLAGDKSNRNQDEQAGYDFFPPYEARVAYFMENPTYMMKVPKNPSNVGPGHWSAHATSVSGRTRALKTTQLKQKERGK